jgi:hypothetical protein
MKIINIKKNKYYSLNDFPPIIKNNINLNHISDEHYLLKNNKTMVKREYANKHILKTKHYNSEVINATDIKNSKFKSAKLYKTSSDISGIWICAKSISSIFKINKFKRRVISGKDKLMKLEYEKDYRFFYKNKKSKSHFLCLSYTGLLIFLIKYQKEYIDEFRKWINGFIKPISKMNYVYLILLGTVEQCSQSILPKLNYNRDSLVCKYGIADDITTKIPKFDAKLKPVVLYCSSINNKCAINAKSKMINCFSNMNVMVDDRDDLIVINENELNVNIKMMFYQINRECSSNIKVIEKEHQKQINAIKSKYSILKTKYLKMSLKNDN